MRFRYYCVVAFIIIIIIIIIIMLRWTLAQIFTDYWFIFWNISLDLLLKTYELLSDLIYWSLYVL